MTGLSWEQMVQHVVVDGRPGDVKSAAEGWKVLLDNLRSVKESLETNVNDLGQVWKGPAYESFKAYIEQQAKMIGRIIQDAEQGEGIYQSLVYAADRLAAAQSEMPVPAAALDDIARARNYKITLDFGLFERKVSADLLFRHPGVQLGGMIHDWLFDKTEEARAVYERINNEYQAKAHAMPEGQAIPKVGVNEYEIPEIGSGPGAGGVPSMPKTGGMGAGGASISGFGSDPGSYPGSPYRGSLGASTPDPAHLGAGTPYAPGFDDDSHGTGLAGAAPAAGTGGGLGAGGGVATGGAGLGGATGAGVGSGGSIPGGGALGRGVAPAVLPGMMGGMGAGAGRGQGGGRRGAAALGGAARAGVGGLPGGAAGGGRGGAGARGMGGVAAMGGLGGHGAGFGSQEHERASWLREDEDVWGADGDAPPGVLR